MGYLHQGHLSLCKRSMRENDSTVVSIFVNPMQFDQPSDFTKYPRALDEDISLLSSFGIDYLFVPDVQSMYPDQYHVKVTETVLSKELEGECRPGHFDGMLTVVLKLLNIIMPTKTYFGEKDYQQLLLVKKMVEALFIPTDIIACETVREKNGLAFSSRNARLSSHDREKAVCFPQLLQSSKTTEEIRDALQQNKFQVDYIVEKWGRRLGAVWLGEVRLIDNVPIE